MAKTLNKDLYEVRVSGTYYGNNGGMKVTESYDETFTMNEEAKKFGFLSAIRNFLLEERLKGKYKNYKRFRTHYITDVTNITSPGKPVMELALMNRAQVVKYIKQKDLPINIDLYPEISDLRQAVKSYHEGKETFLEYQEKRMKSKGTRLTLQRQLAELNADSGNHVKPVTISTEPLSSPEDGVTNVYTQKGNPLSQHYRVDTVDELQDDPTDATDYIDFGDDVYTEDPNTIRIPEFDDGQDIDALLMGL